MPTVAAEIAVRHLAPIGRRDSVSQGTTGRWTNEITGMGGDADTHGHTYFSPWTQPRSPQEIDALLRFSAMARRIVWREPQDSLREGIDLGKPGQKPGEPGGLTDEEKRPILTALRRMDAFGHVRRARAWARAFGGGAIFAAVDDGVDDLRLPIDWTNLRSVRGLVTLDRRECMPVIDWHTRMGYPEHYQVLTAGLQVVVHRSRIIPFDGLDVPRSVRELNDWWGGSLIDLVFDGLRDWASAHSDAAEAVHLLTQGVLKVKDMATRLESGRGSEVQSELEALRLGMGLRNDITLDQDRHDYGVVGRPLAGIGEALGALNEFLVSLTDMPKTILMGQQPGGLNANAESEITAWYDHCRSQQPEIYGPAFDRLIELVTRSAEGPTRGQAFTGEVVWPSLWQETEETRTGNRLRRAQARQIDVAAGVVSPDEARADTDLAAQYDLDPDTPAPPRPELPAAAPAPTDEISDEALTDTPLADMPAGEALIDAQEAKSRLGLGRYSMALRRAHARGDLQAAKMGGRWFYAWSQVVTATRNGLL